MRIQRLSLLLAPEDLTATLAEYPLPERVSDLRVATGDGFLQLRLGYRVGPLTAPVEFLLRVAAVRPERLELAAEVKAGLGLPGPVAREVLAYLVRSTGLSELAVEGRHLVVNLSELGERVGAGFGLAGLRFTPAGIEVELSDLTLAPLEAMGAEQPEVEVLPPLPSPVPAPPPEYGDFYARIRERVRGWASSRVPDRYQKLIPWLLLLPDLFALVVRLSLDPRVSAWAKARLGLTIVYVLSPVDFIPDFIPIAGVSDDLALVLLALAGLLDETPAPVLQEHWSGEGNVVRVIQDGARMVRGLFSGDLIARLKARLGR